MSYRLLKVVCQVVLVSEDEQGNLQEHVTEASNVPAAAWPTFPQQLEAQIAQLNSNGAQNGATRRPDLPEHTLESQGQDVPA